MTNTTFSTADYSAIDSALLQTDRLLADSYPGEDGTRQPVHTVYVPADTFTSTLVSDWGRKAFDAVNKQGGMGELCAEIGVPLHLADQIGAKVTEKLRKEPIEDLRLDFEDGYGLRSDSEEDADTLRVADAVLAAAEANTGPPFIGIRFKSLEQRTRARGLRTLDLFIARLLEGGRLPDGLVLTLPKVSTVAQVEAMVFACEKLEQFHGLQPGRLRFEVQVETPQLILAADGTMPVATLLHLGKGRVSALHYGTYDYSASLEIAASYQAMDHPSADFAKQVMQVAVAGTGVRLSDGSTNILPLGSDENILNAWKLHSTLVQRSLQRGYYQGWDLHPAQLPSRFAATYSFFRQGFAAAASRLQNFAHQLESTVLDEPATARALARFMQRGLLCGAIDPHEIEDEVRISADQLVALAQSGLMPTTEENYD